MGAEKHKGTGGFQKRLLDVKHFHDQNQSFRHWRWQDLVKVKRTVEKRALHHWNNWYVSPFRNFLSLHIFHA